MAPSSASASKSFLDYMRAAFMTEDMKKETSPSKIQQPVDKRLGVLRLACLEQSRRAQHERKMLNDFSVLTVGPKVLEG